MQSGEPHLALDYARKMGDAVDMHTGLKAMAERETPPPDVQKLHPGGVLCAVASYEKLASLMEISEATVKRRLRLLLDEGWIVRLNRSPYPTAYVLGDEKGLFSSKIIRQKSRKPLSRRIPGRKKGLSKPPQKALAHDLSQCSSSFREPVLLDPLNDMDLRKLGVSGDLFGSPLVSHNIPTLENKKVEEYKEKEISPGKKRERKKPLVADWRNRDIKEWKCTTVWAMMRDLLKEDMIFTSLPSADYGRHMAPLKRLIEERGPEEVKKVAEHFCKHYRKFRNALGLKGRVTPTVFCWYYNEIRDAVNGSLTLPTTERRYKEGEAPSEWKAL